MLTALPGASAPQGADGEDEQWVEQGEGPCSDWSDDHEESLRAEEQRARRGESVTSHAGPLGGLGMYIYVCLYGKRVSANWENSRAVQTLLG